MVRRDITLKVVGPVKAIEVNEDTFSKIDEHLQPGKLESLRDFYHRMTKDIPTVYYFVTKREFSNGGSLPCMAMPQTQFVELFETVESSTPNEWFEVISKPGKERSLG